MIITLVIFTAIDYATGVSVGWGAKETNSKRSSVRKMRIYNAKESGLYV